MAKITNRKDGDVVVSAHASTEEVPRVELRDRAIRLVEDLLADPDLELSITGACSRVSEQLGINKLRDWVKQAQIDAGTKPGLSTDQHRRLKELEAENRELRRGSDV
jgi:transposase